LRHGLHASDVDHLAARFRAGPGVVERVAAEVAASLPQRTNGARRDDQVALDEAMRRHMEVRLGTVATRMGRLATWSNVVLPGDLLDSLLELISRIRHRRTVYDEWGFDRKMTTARGLTVLFQGPPGTGKSMVAGVVANELGLDLYRIDLSRIMSKWIGETERNLAAVFDAAEDGQAIILFDEADSLFSKRTEVKSSVDRYANLEVNYLLQRLDSFEGIAVLTTNFGGSIDKAFQRRMSLRLTFPFPDEELREQLWRVHLPPELPTAGDFDLATLAKKYRLSGGYIKNATLRAAFLAAEEKTPLTQEHLERAIRLEYRELGKLADSGVLE
jgi:SpoVK/Ycf46/Vps4 family AAA+-type ATPase